MRQSACLLALLALTIPAPAQSEVHIAARTDGKEGIGTAADPFDGSTQATFDAVLARLKPATAVYIGAGTFHTKGEASFKVQPNTKIRGAGMEVTRIIQDGTGKTHACVFSGRGGGIEIEDLSIDCGYASQRKVNGEVKCNAAAIHLYGSNLAVRRCMVSNYGSPYDAECGENFAVAIFQGPKADGENLLIEDCVFTGMSPLAPCGASVLTISGGPLKNEVQVPSWARGAVARRNHFTGYHRGCHGITMSGCQGAIVEDNTFEHFMGCCVYQDTWPMRNIIIRNNIMTDIDQGVFLAGDHLDMVNFQIRANVMLLHDGLDLKNIVNGVANTDIPHSLAVGDEIMLRDLKITSGSLKPGVRVFVTAVPNRTSFTYSATKGGKIDPADNATGGFVHPLSYGGQMTPSPEGINAFTGGGKVLHPLKNFLIDRNVIRPYSSDGKARIPSTGIRVRGLENSQVVDNVVFDSGNRRGLVIASPKDFASSVICRDNYNSDNTPALPRDDKGNLAAIAAAGPSPVEFGGRKLSRAVDGAGPAKDHRFPGKPGDYALEGDYLYIYTGDGTKHQWKRVGLADY